MLPGNIGFGGHGTPFRFGRETLPATDLPAGIAAGASRAFKALVETADIARMITVACRSCGNDLEDPDDAVCMHCGLPVGSPRHAEADSDSEPVAVPESVPPPLSADNVWRLALWGALLVSIVSVGAITATLLSAMFRSADPEVAVVVTSSATTTTVAAAADVGLGWLSFDPPVAEAITVANPKLDEITRHRAGAEVITFQLDGAFCGSRDGAVVASGVIHNFSMAQQTFDYRISVELIRTWNRARIGFLEATVQDLGPLESAEWGVEMVSSRVTAIDCAITEITATPAG